MLNLSPEATALLTAPYSSANLRAAVKAAAKETLGSSPKVRDRLVQLTGDHSALSAFRNHIAHSTWAHGATRMAIRPITVDVRDGRVKVSGYREGDTDYSTDTMTKLQNQAVKVNQSLYELILSDELSRPWLGKQPSAAFS